MNFFYFEEEISILYAERDAGQTNDLLSPFDKQAIRCDTTRDVKIQV